MRDITYQQRHRIEQTEKLMRRLGKRIMLWRPLGREGEPIPRVLEGYEDYIVIDGDIEVAIHAARQELQGNDRSE